MYKLSNHPNILNQVIYPYAYWDNFLSDELLEITIEYCKDTETDRSFIVNEYGKETEAPDIRKSKVMMHLCNDNNSFVFDKLLDIATYMNDNFFNFMSDVQDEEYCELGVFT